MDLGGIGNTYHFLNGDSLYSTRLEAIAIDCQLLLLYKVISRGRRPKECSHAHATAVD